MTDTELVPVENGQHQELAKPSRYKIEDLQKSDGTPTPLGWRLLSERLGHEMESKQRKGRGGQQFSYVTARQVQDRLDEVVGPANWSTEYTILFHNPERNIIVMECKLTIFGITKADTGTNNNPDIPQWVPCAENDYGKVLDTETGEYRKKNPAWEDEPFKAAYSDSFKRAAVHWNVGRFLYND